MKIRFLKVMSILGLSVLLAACGERVQVPPASVGKVMTSSGYKKGVIPTSSFKLETCLPWEACQKLVTLSTADNVVTEQMTLFMPEDRLNMNFTLQASLRVKEDSVDGLFNSIPPKEDGRKTFIPLDSVYSIYAEQVIRAEAREFLSAYSIDEVSSNLEAINQNLTQKLSKSINEKTPFEVRYIGLSDVKYPQIIVNKQEQAAERTEAIAQEQAQLQLAKVVMDRELQEAKMKRTIEVEKAMADAEVNRIIGDSITPKYVQYKQLEALTEISKSDNKIVVPFEMLNSIAAQNMISR